MAETIGSLVDKISIVGLKAYHMEEQVHRKDATPEHQQACRRRLEILKEQKNDLSTELTELMVLVFSGKKTLKIYRQFKMYNDPKYKAAK